MWDIIISYYQNISTSAVVVNYSNWTGNVGHINTQNLLVFHTQKNVNRLKLKISYRSETCLNSFPNALALQLDVILVKLYDNYVHYI